MPCPIFLFDGSVLFSYHPSAMVRKGGWVIALKCYLVILEPAPICKSAALGGKKELSDKMCDSQAGASNINPY